MLSSYLRFHVRGTRRSAPYLSPSIRCPDPKPCPASPLPRQGPHFHRIGYRCHCTTLPCACSSSLRPLDTTIATSLPRWPPGQVEDERNSPSGFSDIRFSNNGNVLMGVVEGRIYLLDAYKVGARAGQDGGRSVCVAGCCGLRAGGREGRERNDREERGRRNGKEALAVEIQGKGKDWGARGRA